METMVVGFEVLATKTRPHVFWTARYGIHCGSPSRRCASKSLESATLYTDTRKGS